MSPFQAASTLLSRPGCTRCSRAARRIPRARDDVLGQTLHGDAEPLRHLRGLARHVQDAMALEVRPVRHAPEGQRRLRRLRVRDQRADLVRRPDEELALLALGVGVLGGIEAARRDAVISRST